MNWFTKSWNKYMKGSIENSLPPRNLTSALYALSKIVDHNTQRTIEEFGEECVSAKLHHTLGRHLRNEWGLWSGSKLQKWFKSKGVWHADDMSGIIITSYWRQHHGLPLRLPEQIKKYQDYWAKQNVGEPE